MVNEKLKLYCVELSTEVMVIAESATDAERIARYNASLEKYPDAYNANAVEYINNLIVAEGWDKESIPYYDYAADDIKEENLGIWIAREMQRREKLKADKLQMKLFQMEQNNEI